MWPESPATSSLTGHCTLFACSRFRGSHTADAIAEQFANVTATFDIAHEISHIVTDNASNMIKAFSFPGFENIAATDSSDDDSDEECDVMPIAPSSDSTLYEYVNDHVSCFAHTLQLVIKDGFKHAAAIKKVLAKASAIVSHVRRSVDASELLVTEKRLQSANRT